jgi:hypothetical protein
MTTTELLQHKASSRDDLLCLGFVRTQGNKILNENKGKTKPPSWSVDQGVLPQTLEGHEDWWLGRERDLSKVT